MAAGGLFLGNYYSAAERQRAGPCPAEINKTYMFYGKFIMFRGRPLSSDASPQKSHFPVMRQLKHFQFVMPATNQPCEHVGFDQNIQFFICRSAHLEPQCAQVSPGLPAGN
jgi:hypothetical protein